MKDVTMVTKNCADCCNYMTLANQLMSWCDKGHPPCADVRECSDFKQRPESVTTFTNITYGED